MILHRQTVQRAMLKDDRGGVDGDCLPSGEGTCDGLNGLLVIGWLSVGGYQHRAVEDEEVGVGGRKSEVIIVNGIGHGEWQQPVGATVERPQAFQLPFECFEVVVVLVALVIATHVEQRVVGCASDDGVDVAVGVIAGENAVFEPHHALCVEALQQLPLDVGAAQRLVAVRGQETGGGGEDGAMTVALHGASLQDEVVVVLQGVGETSSFC